MKRVTWALATLFLLLLTLPTGAWASSRLYVKENPVVMAADQSRQLVVYDRKTGRPVKCTFESPDDRISVTKGGVVRQRYSDRDYSTVAAMLNGRARLYISLEFENAVERLTLDQSNIALSIGQTHLLDVLPYPENAYSRKGYTFKSSNKRVATVNRKGEIKGVGTGSCTITVTAYNNKRTTARVTVGKPPSSIRIFAPTLTLGERMTFNLDEHPPIFPSRQASGYRYSIENGHCVYMENPTTLYASDTGTCDLVVTADNGARDVCRITVLPGPKDFTLNCPQSFKLVVGDEFTFRYTLPEGTAGVVAMECYYEERGALYTRDDLTIKARRSGLASFTFCSQNGIAKPVHVRIVNPPKPLPPLWPTLKMGLGFVGFLPLTPNEDQPIHWYICSSADPTIARIQNEHSVYGLRKGKTIVTIATDTGQKFYCPVEVGTPIKAIKSRRKYHDVKPLHTRQLTYDILPSNALNKQLKWKSSNPNYFEVDQKGRVTALRSTYWREHAAIITAYSQDGTNVECQFFVRPGV